jgi:anthranilate 1,2-dioxygenase ferredoxin component
MSGTWCSVAAEAEFPETGKLAVKINGWHVFIAKTDDGIFALNDRCAHQAARLSEGRVRRGAAMCPLHGARFDLATGTCIGGSYRAVRIFSVRIRNGMIEIEIPDAAPGLEDLPVAI